MTRKITPQDNAGNIRNPNIGTPGTNRQYDKNQGNRGTQLNPNQQPPGNDDSSEMNDREIFRKLHEKYFGKPPAPSSATPKVEDEDMDQGDVYWYSGCGD
ncbi:hypothetical protein [Acidovorax soli]|uniref:Uncharacterized protein n=1 Tax=Acidovorax soli TaxID=592050 RepID=A0A1H4F368_9BURK|nr:hypothetical protein [Acidovorax soli]SEA91764.1 hypothetical protein SAMN05421875_1479 [Acidovorax soli]